MDRPASATSDRLGDSNGKSSVRDAAEPRILTGRRCRVVDVDVTDDPFVYVENGGGGNQCTPTTLLLFLPPSLSGLLSCLLLFGDFFPCASALLLLPFDCCRLLFDDE